MFEWLSNLSFCEAGILIIGAIIFILIIVLAIFYHNQQSNYGTFN